MTSFENAPFSAIHKKIRAGAYAGMICAGYIIGIVSIALNYASASLNLDSYWMGMIGAGTLFGILFGSSIFAPMADRFGRAKFYNLTMPIFILLSLSHLFITDPQLIALARFGLGLVVGCDYAVEVSMLSEWSPEKKRPQLMGPLVLFWTLGYVASFICGYALHAFLHASWDVILASSAVPCFITLLIRIGTPESPTWQASMGRDTEALATIQKHLGSDVGLPELSEKEVKGSFSQLFSRTWRYNTIVGGVMYATQVLPFFAISIFLPVVLADMKIENPNVSNILYQVLTIVGVFVGTWLLARVSRRAFLIVTFYLAAFLLAVLILFQSMMSSIMLLIVLGLFALVLAICIVIEWPYPAELFPTPLRAAGVGMSTAISRIGAGGGTFLLPIITEKFGASASLGICVAVLIFGGIICHLWAPETSPKFRKATDPQVNGVPVPPIALRR